MIHGRNYGAQTDIQSVTDFLNCKVSALDLYDSGGGRSLYPINPKGLTTTGETPQGLTYTMFQWNGSVASIIPSNGSPASGNMQSSMDAVQSAKGSFPIYNFMSWPMFYYLRYGRPSAEIAKYITKSYSSLTINDIHDATVKWAQDTRNKMVARFGAREAERMITAYEESLAESEAQGVPRTQAEGMAEEAAEIARVLAGPEAYGRALEDTAEEDTEEKEGSSLLPKLAIAAISAAVGFGAVKIIQERRGI